MNKYWSFFAKFDRVTLAALLLTRGAQLMPLWLVLSALELDALVQVSALDVLPVIYSFISIAAKFELIILLIYRCIWSLHWCLHFLALDQQCPCCKIIFVHILGGINFWCHLWVSNTFLGICLVWMYFQDNFPHWWWHLQCWPEHCRLFLWWWWLPFIWLRFWNLTDQLLFWLEIHFQNLKYTCLRNPYDKCLPLKALCIWC